MNAAKRQNLSELVAARIKQLILEQQLKPGDRLPTEQEMAERFGVSRVSVREATKALNFLGIIQAAPRRGLTIGKFDMARVSEYLGFHFAINRFDKQQLLTSRLVIEGGALPFIATALAQDGSLAESLQDWIRAGVNLRDPQDQIQHDLTFHLNLLNASGVGPSVVFANLLQIFFDLFATPLTAEHWSAANDEHARLVDLLAQGRIEAARDLLGQHLNRYRSQGAESQRES